MNLEALLPLLLPRAIAWAEAIANDVVAKAQTLAPAEFSIARRAGVGFPERIRVLLVTEMPLPEDPHLAEAAQRLGLLGPGLDGLKPPPALRTSAQVGHVGRVRMQIHAGAITYDIAPWKSGWLHDSIREGCVSKARSGMLRGIVKNFREILDIVLGSPLFASFRAMGLAETRPLV